MLPLWAISYLSYDKDHMRSTNVWSPSFLFLSLFLLLIWNTFVLFIYVLTIGKSQALTKSISIHSTRLTYLEFLHSFANLFVMITFLCKARQWTTSIHCFGLSSFSHEYLLFINYTVTDSLFYQGYYIYIYIFIYILLCINVYRAHF